MIRQTPHVSHGTYREYCYLCSNVIRAANRDEWYERRGMALGFAQALCHIGYESYIMQMRAQRMWVEQDKATVGVPLSFDDPPTLRVDDWEAEPIEDPWDDIIDRWDDDEFVLDTEEPVLRGTILVGQHPYQDDWDWFSGIPGKCGAPFCGKHGEHNIHLKPEPHEWEEHPQAPGLCRECGCPKDREWHTD